MVFMWISWTLFTVACVLCIVELLLRRPKCDEPPKLSGYLPILGHIHLIMGGSKDILKVIRKGTEESYTKGNALSFGLGPLLMYVLTDPDDCLTVANMCLETTYSFANDVFGNGLLTCPVSVWKRHRKLLNHAFSQHVLDQFMPIFNQQALRLVEAFRPEVGKGPFDYLPSLRRNTLQTICLTAMGIDTMEDTALNLNYLEAVDQIFQTFVERLMNPWLHINFLYGFSEVKKRQQKYMKDFHKMSTTVLKRKKEQLQQIPAETSQNIKQKSLIDVLLEDGVFTDLEIKEEVDTFMAAGHETTATLLVFVLVLIGSFTDVQERIVAEFKQMFENRNNYEDLRRQDISRLYYLDAVIKETLRYYSLVPFVLRKLDKDVKLKNYTLRSGRLCMLLLYALHRHPMWGADADQFKPERWLDPTTSPHHPAAFAGFSIGKRNCIGQNYAMMSIKTVVVHLLRHYNVKSDHKKLQLKVDFIFRADQGYDICLESRKL